MHNSSLAPFKIFCTFIFYSILILMYLNMDLSLSSLIFPAFFESIGYILSPNKGSLDHVSSKKYLVLRSFSSPCRTSITRMLTFKKKFLSYRSLRGSIYSPLIFFFFPLCLSGCIISIDLFSSLLAI